MALPEADIAVRDQINLAVPTLTVGVNLYAGPVRAAVDSIPSEAVFVLASGGSFDDNMRSSILRRPFVQVRIRSRLGSGAFQSGQALARQVYDAIDLLPPLGYCDARAGAGGPIYLGADTDGHHEWSINVALSVVQTSGGGSPAYYIGVTDNAGPLTADQVLDLVRVSGLTSPAISTLISPVLQYIWYFYDNAFAGKVPGDFLIGTVGPGDVTELQTGLSVTDSFGVTGLYAGARSDNILDATIVGAPMIFVVT